MQVDEIPRDAGIAIQFDDAVDRFGVLGSCEPQADGAIGDDPAWGKRAGDGNQRATDRNALEVEPGLYRVVRCRV
jgi:hypothetical protein